MFVSFRALMIGRQMWWMISFNSWHPFYLPWLMVIIWDGTCKKKGISLSAHIIISYMALLSLLFLGKVFGRLRHPGVCHSLFEQPHGTGSSQEISWDSGALISLTSALCVVAAVRQWIICCYIVERLISYGAFSLGFLWFHGFPRVWCKFVYLVGGIGWGSILLTFGI